MSAEPKDFRTPQAKKWADDYIPPETCGSIDDVQNALEHLRDANSQLRHAAHLWRHVAEDELARRQELGRRLTELCDQIDYAEDHGDGAYDELCPICIAYADARAALVNAAALNSTYPAESRVGVRAISEQGTLPPDEPEPSIDTVRGVGGETGSSRELAHTASVKVLTDLLARLEAAEGPDRLTELDLFDALCEPERLENPLQTDGSRIPNFTRSLDASLALVERVLPGVWWHVANGKLVAGEPLFGAILYFTHEEELGGGEHETSAAIAVLIALIRAIIANADTSERPVKP